MQSSRLIAGMAAVLAANTAVMAQTPGGGTPGASSPGVQVGAPPYMAWESFDLDSSKRIRLDFRNADIDAVLRAFSNASKVTIIKDPALTAPMTLQSPNAQPLAPAFSMLNKALELRNYHLVREGNFLMVKSRQPRAASRRGAAAPASPAATPAAPAPAFDPGRRGGGDQLEIRVYTIRFANATQVARVINEVFATYAAPNPAQPQAAPAPGAPPPAPAPQSQSALPDNAYQVAQIGGRFGGRRQRQGGSAASAAAGSLVKASADDFSNSVIVNAPSSLHPQIERIVAQIDRQTEQPQQSRVFKLEFATASDTAVVIQNVLLSNAPRGRGGLTPGMTSTPPGQRPAFGTRAATQTALGSVVPDTRTNSVIVTATQENLQIVEAVIRELDKEVTVENSSFVINLKNANADAIADLINQATGGRATTGAARPAAPGAAPAGGAQNANPAGNNGPGTLRGRY